MADFTVKHTQHYTWWGQNQISKARTEESWSVHVCACMRACACMRLCVCVYWGTLSCCSHSSSAIYNRSPITTLVNENKWGRTLVVFLISSSLYFSKRNKHRNKSSIPHVRSKNPEWTISSWSLIRLLLAHNLSLNALEQYKRGKGN